MTCSTIAGRWKKLDLVMSSSSVNAIRSRDSATLVARRARILQDARIEKVEGRKVSAHEAIKESGSEATQRPSDSFTFRESINTLKSPSTSSTGNSGLAALV